MLIIPGRERLHNQALSSKNQLSKRGFICILVDMSAKKDLSLAKFLHNAQSAIRSIETNPSKEWQKALAILSGTSGKVILSGIGKSGHIGVKLAATFISLHITAVFVHPAEAFHGDLGLIGKGDVMIALSHSGETPELLKLVQRVRGYQIPIIAITGNANSTLGKAGTAVLTYKIKEEGSPFNIAPMASTMATLVIGDYLASSVSASKGISPKEFAESHPGGSLGLRLTKVKELMLPKKKTPLVRQNTSLKDALQVMDDAKLGVIGVVDVRGRLCGVLSDGDIRRILVSGTFSYDAPIKNYMHAKPKRIAPSDSLQTALHEMETYKITSLFVVNEKQEIAGIIHMHAIVEHKVV